jgi:Tfp pilus assembly ATPase PilU
LLFTVDKPLQVESFGELKPVISDLGVEALTPFQTETAALNLMGDNPWHISDLLRRGSVIRLIHSPTGRAFVLASSHSEGINSIVLRKLNTVIPTLEMLQFRTRSEKSPARRQDSC